MLRHILLYILVLDRTLPGIDLLYLRLHDIHSGHIVVLGQQDGKGKADIACAGHSDLLAFYRFDLRLVIHNDIGRLETKHSAEAQKLIHRRAVVLHLKP